MEPLQIWRSRLWGPDIQVLRSISLQLVELLKKVKGNTNVNIEQEGPQPQLHIAIDRQKLASYQLSGRHVNGVINTAIGGRPVSEIYERERRFDIVVKFEANQVNTPGKIDGIGHQIYKHLLNPECVTIGDDIFFGVTFKIYFQSIEL